MKKHIIGIDLGGTNLKIGLLGPNCDLLEKKSLTTCQFVAKEELISAICASVSSWGLPKKAILGIGLGLPGPIDTKRGIVHFFPNIPGWKNVGLRDILRKRLGCAVYIDNDANLMALAESRLGAARGCSNAVCLTLGTGVGGGIIIDGELYRGSTFSAGEAGHMPINEDGPMCGCGSYACLESYVGNKKILAAARRAFKRDISLEELSRLAARGDRRARAIWCDVGAKIGVALSGIINLLNPDCVVIGGGVANAGPILFNSIRETVLCRAMLVQAKHVKIKKALLSDSGIIGAGLLVKEGR